MGGDITKTASYTKEFRQAYDSGRPFFYRPDLDLPAHQKEWKTFQAGHILHHENHQSDIVTALDNILNGGGQMAPTTDKLRRGIPLGGWSPQQDLNTGGASYFFTRVQPRAHGFNHEGFIFKPKLLTRTDAISYRGDMYGDVTGNTVLNHRQTTITEWASTAKSNPGGNEVNFKNSLSIFDDLEAIVLSTQAKRKQVLDIFKKHSYKQWQMAASSKT